METLGKLFGGEARIKMLRLFLLAPEKTFQINEAAKILKISKKNTASEARFLVSLGFLRKKSFKKNTSFYLWRIFPYLLPLRNLLITASPVSRDKMLKFFKSRGRIKLLILAGVFLDDFSVDVLDVNRLDILVVGDIKRPPAERFVKKLEAEVGKELNWTLMNVLEFEQRRAMHDKLLRDLFDYPHEVLINKLGIE
ncbi:hypothetical protein HYS99_01340 [Candidatus Giovannonibacteria bacterium]|nr:hypothetical protein [Candidatus Giovannonibacteria bacterium]